MKAITRILAVGMAVTLVGCKTVHEVERDAATAREDVDKAISFWRDDVVPRLHEMEKAFAEIEADFKMDAAEAGKLWEADVKPRLTELEKAFGVLKADFKKDMAEAKTTWRDDIEPRIARLERIAKTFEAQFEKDLKAVMTFWHKDVESMLTRMERAVGTAEADVKNFSKDYDSLKVGLRSMKVRVMSDVADSPVAERVESLLGHVRSLEKSHAAGLAASAIAKARVGIESDVSKALSLL